MYRTSEDHEDGMDNNETAIMCNSAQTLEVRTHRAEIQGLYRAFDDYAVCAERAGN